MRSLNRTHTKATLQAAWGFPRMLTLSGLVREGRKEMVRPPVMDSSFSCVQRAIKPLADDGIPLACDNGLREPSRETLNPWMLPVPGVRT